MQSLGQKAEITLSNNLKERNLMNETAKSISSAAVLEAPQKAVSSQGVSPAPLSPELLQKMDAWWRAANYLNIRQIYLMANWVWSD